VIAQRLADAGERLRQDLEHRLDRATDDARRIKGKDDRGDDQTGDTADQRIERALERQPIDRGLDRCDKHCGDRGLRDREGSAPEQPYRDHRSEHHHGDQDRPGAEPEDQRVGDRNPQGDPQSDLDGSAQAFVCRQPEREHRS
jgi:hypothetical protein